MGGLGESGPNRPGDIRPANLGETDVERGLSPGAAGGTGSGDDGGRPGDGVSRGDLVTRRGATEADATLFLSPIPKGGGTSTKPLCVSVRAPSLLKSNCLVSSSEIDPTEPNEPLVVLGPYVEADVNDVLDAKVEADIEDEPDTEAETIVLDVDTATGGVGANLVSDTEIPNEAPFASSPLPYSASPGTSFSVSAELTDDNVPLLDLDLTEAASAVE